MISDMGKSEPKSEEAFRGRASRSPVHPQRAQSFVGSWTTKSNSQQGYLSLSYAKAVNFESGATPIVHESMTDDEMLGCRV